MPIHLIWGDDYGSSEITIEKLILQHTDPAWIQFNLNKFDGSDGAQAMQALEACITPPFGSGGRVIVLKKSPFCNNCSSELATRFTNTIDLIPDQSHLILQNTNKPDKRLKITKILEKLIKSKQAEEQKCMLPPFWDGAGQKELVTRIAQELQLNISEDGIFALIEALGSDSSRLRSEMDKISIYADSIQKQSSSISKNLLITNEIVSKLVGGLSTNALKAGEALLAGDPIEAIKKIDALLNSGEPALRILSTMTSQIRGWLWITLLEKKGEKDITVIAKKAGIANPKRIYVLRKQTIGKTPGMFLKALSQMLEIEERLKRGGLAPNVFRDVLLTEH